MADKLEEKTTYTDEEVDDLVRMWLCLLIYSVLFVNSRPYLSNKLITHVIDIDGLHHLNWAGAMLRETLALIPHCRGCVRA